MPAIRLFHRRTILGGDDLQPAAFVSVMLRCLQMTLFLGPVVIQIIKESYNRGSLVTFVLYDANNDPDCRHSHLFATMLTVYAAASAVAAVLSILLDVRIAHWSSQGCPVETEPRSSKVSHLLEYKLVPSSVLLFLVWMTGMSAVSFAPNYYQCQAADTTFKFWWLALAALLITQIAEVLVSWSYLLHLCRQPVVVAAAVPSESSTNNRSSNWNTTSPHAAAEQYSLHPAGRGPENHELVEEMWADRCADACHCLSTASCFMFGGRELSAASFDGVARALADYLETRGVLDVVPSDIVTGFFVLQRLQRKRIYQARLNVLQELHQASSLEEGDDSRRNTNNRTYRDEEEENVGGRDELMIPLDSPGHGRENNDNNSITSPQKTVYRLEPDGSYERRQRTLLSPCDFGDMRVLEEGARYAKFALAIYTWVLYLYEHPLSGPTRLMAKAGCSCFGCCRRRRSSTVGRLSPRFSSAIDENGRIEGDNLCETNKSALLLTAGLRDTDLVYAQLRSSFSEIPYCILLDHRWRSVVVSVRGTFSLEDCVTDVLIEPESLERLGQDFGFDAAGQHCHGGVLACARNVYRDLERHGLLDQLLLGDRALYPGYTLRLVGHSLGAATSTLLSFMLRPKFPTLRCVNYSPPGCTFTWEMATECKEWCTSFVLDSDIVPRLSLDSMERLRDEILELIGRIKVPKIEVATSVFGSTALWGWRLCSEHNLTEDQESIVRSLEQILHDPDDVPDSEYRRQLERFRVIQEERRQARGAIRSIKLFPPGKIVHLVKTGEKKTCMHAIAKCLTCCTTNIGFEYSPIYINNDDLNEIVVTPTLTTDHFPNRMRFILEGVATDFGLC